MMKLTCLILLILPFGADGIFAQSNVAASPNPFEDEVTFTTTAQCGDSILFDVYNILGQVMLHHEEKIATPSDTFVYQVNLPKGVYIARVAIDTLTTATRVIRSEEGGPATVRLDLRGTNCDNQPFGIFPNPSLDGTFKIRQVNIDRSYEVEIFDLTGKRLWFEAVQGRSDEEHLIDLSAHPAGSYSFRIRSLGEEYSSIIVLQ